MKKWLKIVLLSSTVVLLAACTDTEDAANETSVADETTELVEESLPEIEIETEESSESETADPESESSEEEENVEQESTSEEGTEEESETSSESETSTSESESSEDEEEAEVALTSVEESESEESEESESESESESEESESESESVSDEESSSSSSSSEEDSESATSESEADETTATDETPDSSEMTEAIQPVEVDMLNQDGDSVGTATLEEAANGIILTLELEGLPEGEFGFHIHEYGQATPPTFLDALGHFNPTDAFHGLQAENGPHMGDFPNLVVGPDGTVNITLVISNLSLDPEASYTLRTENGTSLIIHEGPDDYVSQPLGNAGYPMIGGVIFAPMSETDEEESSEETSSESDEESSEESESSN